LREFDPQLHTTFMNILKSDKVQDMDLTFTVTYDNYGMEEIVELCPNGKQVAVTNENKREFIEAYTDWYLNKSVQAQFEPFHEGFYKVISKESIRVFNFVM
jgi:hypothetical protein